MRSDPYRTYIETLNASEPYPPFGEVRDLVMQQQGRRKAAFVPFYKYAAGAALLAVIGLGFSEHFFANKPLQDVRMTHTSQGTHGSHATDGLISTDVSLKEVTKNIASQKESVKNNSENKSQAKPVLANFNQKNVPATNATPAHATETQDAPPANTHVIITTAIPSSVGVTMGELSNQNATDANHWTAFLSGGSFVPNNNFSMSSIVGAAGVRYQIFGSSSIVVELRRSSFLVNHAAQSGGFRDTTLIAGGTQYPATIGTPAQPAATSTSQVNSLDLGYRFDMNPNGVLSPCAEIVAGASTSGFLSSEAVGVEYGLTNALSLDVSARAEELFSPASVPLTAFGFEAGIAFEW